ncbi:MAG TPA: amidase [Bryobacteraceae bacterium]|nr:amidase [Bryobacteraceae bacterium]
MQKTKLDESTLPFATIPQLSAALKSREISCRELVKFYGKRLETLGPLYNALACSLLKHAHDFAKDIDEDFKVDRFRGPLQGIPYGAKDLIAVAKFPTTWGAKPYAEQVFEESATVIHRLEAAHAVIIGKLSMVELAGGGGYSSAAASLQGPGLNPWDKQYWSGGSSSGSGAAVAAGLVPFALGSETSGSILTPACYCGLTGLRPTYGLVSRHGAMALSWTLDKIGVLTHTAEDSALVLQRIAGGDDADPGSAHKSFYYTPQYYRPTSSLRVGYAEIDWTEWPDEPLRPAFVSALSTLRSLGAQMIESRLPDFPYGAVIGTIIDSEAGSIFEQLIRGGNVNQLADQSQIDGLRASLTYSATDYLKATRVRTQIQAAFRDIFSNVELLVAPTKLSIPDRADQPFDETPPKRPDQKGVYAGLVQASNLCGFPAITIPCGIVNGLPIGLQIVGPPFQENRVVAFASAFQQQTNFHQQHPPVPA